MEYFATYILGALSGAAALMLVAAMSGPPYTSLLMAQQDYAKCLSLQAPQQVCLKTYLLPKDAAN